MIMWLIQKLFLVKEIVSRAGDIHFQRYRLLSTPWFKIYLHKIMRSDEDKHMHDHPWDFTSIILKGSYKESYAVGPQWGLVKEKTYKLFQMNSHKHDDVHKIEILKGPVWTLFFVGTRTYEWGYQTQIGWIDHERYRTMKHNGQL